MRYRPDDAELLDAIALLLEEEVLPAVGPDLQHKVRVAANLTRILQRQEALEAGALDRERRALVGLLGEEGDLLELRAELERRLRHDDVDLDDRSVWEALVATARDDLASAKPGYDVWEGE